MCPPTCAPGATSLTLLDVFRMGTSFSALILASRSSHARPVFWKRILFPGVGAGAAEAGDDRTRAWLSSLIYPRRIKSQNAIILQCECYFKGGRTLWQMCKTVTP